MCGELCVVYIQKEDLRYWLVPGNVKNNRIPPEPCTEVYCLRLNFNISELVY